MRLPSIKKVVVDVINLGRMGFVPAWDIQIRYQNQHLDQIAGKESAVGRNVLLLVEHNPVYTTGLRSEIYGKRDEQTLKAMGAEFIRANRGGLITFHGHGQLVAYPILNLRDFTPSMKWYIGALEKTMIQTCKHFGLEAGVTEHTGVWVRDKKIGAIGVHGRRFVTTHGVALNCNTDLSWFKNIVPCGIEGKEVTSLTQETEQEVTIEQTIAPFIEAFEEQFQCSVEASLLEADEYSLLPDRSGLNLQEEAVAETRTQ